MLKAAEVEEVIFELSNQYQSEAYLMHIISSIGNSISQQNAEQDNNFVGYEMVTEKEGLIIKE